MRIVASHRKLVLTLLDVLAILSAHGLAFLLRFDFAVPRAELPGLLASCPWPVLAYLAASRRFGLMGQRYRANMGDAFDIVKAVSAAAVLQGAVIWATIPGFPRSVLLLGPLLSVLCVTGLHAFARAASHFLYVHLLGHAQRRTAVIVGSGDLAEQVYQNMRCDDAVDYRVAAFVGDPGRFGGRLHGVRVTGPGTLAQVLAACAVDEIVIAVDRHERGAALDAVADALDAGGPRPDVFVAPTLEESLKSSSRPEPRKVRPADLLNRRVISLDTATIGRSIAGKVALISGAGGTIGSELSRQVALYKPRKVILLENNATALFYGEARLREAAPAAEVLAVLGDVRDASLVSRLFEEEKPHLVFHAAAHKHVHQLETNVCEGVSNNLLGTYQLATAADRAGAEAFILISTDKAVRPTSVMGATKRAAELVVSSLAQRSKTRFASVRFGNVLGSSGSVMRIFQDQIEEGQPLTITHPEATRYFMTVEEAVGLVLQASALAKGGEIFVLKMGDQVRIVDMARRLILLSGLEPERDVPIRFVGLRQGEKLSEELVEEDTGQEPSEHPDIMVLRTRHDEPATLAERIMAIELMRTSGEKETMLRALTQLAPTFRAAGGTDGSRIQQVEGENHGASTN